MVRLEKINVNINCFMVAAILLIFFLMMALNSYTPITVDDMVSMFSKNMTKIESISDIIANEKYKYIYANPHQVGNFIAGVLLLLDENIANLINSMVFCIFIYLVYNYSMIDKDRFGSQKVIDSAITSLIFLVIWVSMPKFGNTFLIVSSFAKYVWTSIICLIVLIEARKIALKDKEAKDKVGDSLGISKMLVLILASFFAGWSQENLAISVISIMIFYLVKAFLSKKEDLVILILSLISMLTGFLIMMSSPSRKIVTQDSLVVERDLYDGLSRVSVFDNEFVNYILVFMLVAIVLLVISRLVYVEKNWEAEIYLLAGILSFFSMSLLSSTEKNPSFAPILFFIISSLISFSVIRKRYLKFTMLLTGLVLLAYVVLFSVSLPDALLANKNYLSKYSAREIIIIDNRTNGYLENIQVPRIKANNPYMAAYRSLDCSKDPKYWVNQYISKYYNVGSVLVR